MASTDKMDNILICMEYYFEDYASNNTQPFFNLRYSEGDEPIILVKIRLK